MRCPTIGPLPVPVFIHYTNCILICGVFWFAINFQVFTQLWGPNLICDNQVNITLGFSTQITCTFFTTKCNEDLAMIFREKFECFLFKLRFSLPWLNFGLLLCLHFLQWPLLLPREKLTQNQSKKNTLR